MARGLYLGGSEFLQLAFPPALRKEIGAQADMFAVDIDGQKWRENREALAEAEWIFSTWGMPNLDGEFLEAVPRLKAIFYAAGSVKCFATALAYDRGIQVCSAWRANAVPVAEYTLATILLSLRQFWACAASTRAAKTFRRVPGIPGAYRSRVGLVSLGAIGRLVARRLQDFDVEVLASDPLVDEETAHALGTRLLSLEELFSEADVISLHTPWLPETVGLVGAAQLSRMKEGATLINTSRGAIINEPDLIAALTARPDLTAILDVTHPEPPPPDSPLYTLPNAILTPHIAGSLGGEIGRMGQWMADEFFRYLGGSPLHHAVTRDMLAQMA